jgi:hypothetical protein
VCIFLAVGLLAACAPEPPVGSRPTNHFSAVPGGDFHAVGVGAGYAAPSAGFSAPAANMGSPAPVGSYGGLPNMGAAVPTQDYHPSGIPAGLRPQ